MGADLYEQNAQVRDRFDQARDILGIDLPNIMFNGSEEDLKQTKITQPAIYLHSIALFEHVSLTADAFAGHSLGEFTALVASGALSFEDGLRIVAARGAAMQAAGEAQEGTMAAIIGLANEQVEELCVQASKIAMVVPANFNATGQVVISGTPAGVSKAIELAKAAGCRLAKELPVSGAFHSDLMNAALDGLMQALDKANFSDAKHPVYANVNAEPATKAEQLRQNVIEQLTQPVRWTQSLLKMQEDGFDTFVEVGPGKVLQGLVKRTLKGVTIEGY